MTVHWYALHSKPRKETLLWEQLSLHEIECYYPRIHVQPANPRSRKVKPYFPGYVFAHMDLGQTNISILRWLPGLSRLVTFGGIPAHIPDYLIAAIRRRADKIEISNEKLFDGLKVGDVVSVVGGPFSGYEAIFDVCLPGVERVRVLLKLLADRQMPVELPLEFVRPIK